MASEKLSPISAIFSSVSQHSLLHKFLLLFVWSTSCSRTFSGDQTSQHSSIFFGISPACQYAFLCDSLYSFSTAFAFCSALLDFLLDGYQCRVLLLWWPSFRLEYIYLLYLCIWRHGYLSQCVGYLFFWSEYLLTLAYHIIIHIHMVLSTSTSFILKVPRKRWGIPVLIHRLHRPARHLLPAIMTSLIRLPHVLLGPCAKHIFADNGVDIGFRLGSMAMSIRANGFRWHLLLHCASKSRCVTMLVFGYRSVTDVHISIICEAAVFWCLVRQQLLSWCFVFRYAQRALA